MPQNASQSFCEVLLTGTDPRFPDIQIFGLLNSAVVTLSCVYLLSVLSAQYRAQHDEQFLPMLQLLNPERHSRRARPGRNVLPRYHTFLAFACVSGLITSFAFISSHSIRVPMVSLTSIVSFTSDMLLVVQLLRPVRCSEGRTIVLAGLLAVGVFVAQVVMPEPVLPASCDFCGVHILKPATAYVWLVVGAFFAYCAVCCEFGRHPLQPPACLCASRAGPAAWRVRPALAGWCAFLAVPFLTSAVAILFFLDSRPARTAPADDEPCTPSGNFGFCMLAVCDAFYSCGYAPMLLRTITADSQFAREHMLIDAVGESSAAGRAWQQPSGADGPASEGAAATTAGCGASFPMGRAEPGALLSVLSIPQFQLIDPNDLEKRRTIGGGGFGDVSFALWKGAPVAVKVLRVQAAQGDTLRRLADEARTLASLRHPNTVLFIGATLSPLGCALVTEYMPGGSVFELIHARRGGGGGLGWAVRLLVLQSAAHGMAYLHAKGILHRDLKSANLLLDSLERPRVVKLCDFGLSLAVDASLGASLAAFGTPQWCAPEVLRSDSFGPASDVYSFGVVCWELAELDNQPFGTMSPIRVAHEVAYNNLTLQLRTEAAAACPAGITLLLRSCLRAKPTERPTFDALVATLDTLSATPDRLARALAERAAADEAVGGGPAPVGGDDQGAAVPRVPVVSSSSTHTVQ